MYKQGIKLFSKLNREPTRQELAKALNMTEKKIDELMVLAKGNPISLNYENEDGGTLENIVPDDKITSIDTVLGQNLAKEQVEKLLECLTAREEKVIRMRFGIRYKKNHTLEEVGKKMGVTRERIRQIEEKALGKLSREAKRKNIKPITKSFYRKEEQSMNKDRKEVIKEATGIYECQKQGISVEKLSSKFKKSKSYINTMLGLAKDPGVQKHYLSGMSLNNAYALVCLPPAVQDEFAKRIKETGIKGVYKEIVARKKELGVGHNRGVLTEIIADATIEEKLTGKKDKSKIISKQKINGNGSNSVTLGWAIQRAQLILGQVKEAISYGDEEILVKQCELLVKETELLISEYEKMKSA